MEVGAKVEGVGEVICLEACLGGHGDGRVCMRAAGEGGAA